MARRNQVRIVKGSYCRLVPGDIVEMLYDQQGRYAFRVSYSPNAPLLGRPVCGVSAAIASLFLNRLTPHFTLVLHLQLLEISSSMTLKDGVLLASHCLPLVIPTALCSTVSAFRSAGVGTTAGPNLAVNQGPNRESSQRVSWLLSSLDFAHAASLSIASLALTLRAGFLRSLQSIAPESVLAEVAQRIVDVATNDADALWVRIASGRAAVPAPPAPNSLLPLPIGTPLLPIERAALLARAVMSRLSTNVEALRSLQDRRRPVFILPDGTSARRYHQFPAEHDIASPLVAAQSSEIITHAAQSLLGPPPRVPAEGPLDPLHRRLWRLEHQSVPSVRVLELEQDGMDVHNVVNAQDEALRERGDTAMHSVERADLNEGGSFRMFASSSGMGAGAASAAASGVEWPGWDVFLWDYLPLVHDSVGRVGGGGAGNHPIATTALVASSGGDASAKLRMAEPQGRIASSLYLHVDEDVEEGEGAADEAVEGEAVGGKPGDVDDIFEDSGVFNCDDPERFKSAPGGGDVPPTGVPRSVSRLGRGSARHTHSAATSQTEHVAQQSRVRKRARPSNMGGVWSSSFTAEGSSLVGGEASHGRGVSVRPNAGFAAGPDCCAPPHADGGRLELDALDAPNPPAAQNVSGVVESCVDGGASRSRAPDSAVQLSRSLIARQRMTDAAALEQLSALHLRCVPEGGGAGDFDEVNEDGSTALLPDDDLPEMDSAQVARLEIADLPSETFSLVLRCGHDARTPTFF